MPHSGRLSQRRRPLELHERNAPMEKNCYTCFWGGDGEEIDDCGHCWKHNGEVDFEQPPKDQGCDEWTRKDGE